MLGDRLGDGRRGAGLLGVDAADAALQAGDLDDDLAHQVGFGVLGGDHRGRQLAADPHREALVGGRGHGARGSAGRSAGPASHCVSSTRRADWSASEPSLAWNTTSPSLDGHGLEALGEVAVVGELGVVEAAFEHALVAVSDERRRGRVGV